MLAAGSDVRRSALIDPHLISVPSTTATFAPHAANTAIALPANSTSTPGPLRALLSFRVSDLLFLSLGCCALLLSLGQQGEWRLQRHTVISHIAASSSASLPSAIRAQPIVADLDGDARNGQLATAISAPPVTQSLLATPHRSLLLLLRQN